MSKRTYNRSKEDKPLVWLAEKIKTPPFSENARREAGLLLRQLQQGETVVMPLSRSMSDIGPRCHELRITDKNCIWRIMYRIEPDAIVILEVLKKKTESTPDDVIDQCKARLSYYLRVTK